MAIYMNWNNNAVKGPVETDGFKDQIELNSLQFGVGRGIGSAAQGSETRVTSEASVSEITVTLDYMKATADLFKEALTGSPDKTVVVSFTQQGKGASGGVDTYLILTLSDTTLSGFSISSGGDRPSISMSLNFSKVEYKAQSISDKADVKPNAVTYDMKTNKLS